MADEKMKTYKKAYQAAHKDELKIYRKEYYEAHKTKANENSKKYNEAHKTEIKAYDKFHQKQHYCCEDISQVENYSLAKADNFVNWDIHHKLETHTLDGIRRSVNITSKELMKLDMYYNRPASELIFMKHSEHISLHHKKKH